MINATVFVCCLSCFLFFSSLFLLPKDDVDEICPDGTCPIGVDFGVVGVEGDSFDGDVSAFGAGSGGISSEEEES